MKYIVFSVPDMPNAPIIFPDWVNHCDVSEAMRKAYVWETVSAGFLNINESTGELVAWGQSESLKLKARFEDTDLIRRIFKL